MTGAAVLVTGATGTVGRAVADHLVRAGVPVVAAVRSDTDVDRIPARATPRRFSFGFSREQCRRALEGVDRVFLMRPPAIADVERYLFPLIDAANGAGVRQIAFLSLQGVQANRRTPHHAVEQYLRDTGAPYTFLRPNFFMQNLSATYAQRIRERDELFVPAGRSHTAFVDARDVGRVAATVLSQPGHLRAAYTLSGERSYTYARVAERMSELIGRPICYARPGEKEYLADLAARGAPQDYLDAQKMIHRVVRLNVSAFPNRVIRRLTGAPATGLDEFIRDYRGAWE